MTPLLIWDWPDTPVAIGITLLLGSLLQAVIGWSVNRVTAAALKRGDEHAAASRTQLAVRVLAHATGLDSKRHTQRTATMGSLLRSVAGVVIWGSVLLTCLTIVGVPLTPFLASAGVGGIALAFGTQSLVKDYVTGIFLILEDQYGVGDFVTIGDITGTIEEVTLRVTRLRDTMGKVWYVRNGEVVKVGNLSQGYSTAYVDLPVAANTDPAKAIEILKQICDEVAEDDQWADDLLEPPEVLGVESVNNANMTLRVLVKSPPNKQYGVSREIRERAALGFGRAGIHTSTWPDGVVRPE